MVATALFIRTHRETKVQDEKVDQARPAGTLVCVTELRKVCDQIRSAHPTMSTRVEDAGVTYAALVAPNVTPDSAKIDAWLVPQPWPSMVEEKRGLAGLDPIFGDASGVLGRSPLVLAVWKDRLGALQKSCPQGSVDWKCLGTVAGKPWSDVGGEAAWGQVKPGHPAAANNATGLFVFAQATQQFLGNATYARQDLEDGNYRTWAGNLEQNIPTFTPSSGTALDQMLSQGRSAFDVAGSIEAFAGPAVSTSRDKDNITILYPSPVATADLFVIALRGSDPGGRVKAVLESASSAQVLAQNGWRVAGQPSATGVSGDPALPVGNGLPRAGVLQATRETWADIQ